MKEGGARGVLAKKLGETAVEVARIFDDEEKSSRKLFGFAKRNAGAQKKIDEKWRGDGEEKSVQTEHLYELNEGQRMAVREIFETAFVAKRWRFMGLNFLRGISFGLGTFLGGTIVVALVVWILTQTVDIFPWARDFTQHLIDSLRK